MLNCRIKVSDFFLFPEKISGVSPRSLPVCWAGATGAGAAGAGAAGAGAAMITRGSGEGVLVKGGGAGT
jgi:hypothetical protein